MMTIMLLFDWYVAKLMNGIRNVQKLYDHVALRFGTYISFAGLEDIKKITIIFAQFLEHHVLVLKHAISKYIQSCFQVVFLIRF